MTAFTSATLGRPWRTGGGAASASDCRSGSRKPAAALHRQARLLQIDAGTSLVQQGKAHQEAKKVMEMAGYWAGHAVQGVATGEMLIPIVGYLGTDQQTSME
eukprot:gene53368-65185_t